MKSKASGQKLRKLKHKVNTLMKYPPLDLSRAVALPERKEAYILDRMPLCIEQISALGNVCWVTIAQF